MAFYHFIIGHKPFEKNAGNTTAGSLNKKWRPKEQKCININVITLDSFIVAENIKKIDLMKIDVETLEFEVLEGYKSHLLIHKPIIILEIQNTEIGNNINTFFEENNYSYFNIDESKGLVHVTKLGNREHHNYLICHNEKLEQIQKISSMI